MAAGDFKKPHVDVDIREYSPGTMRTRAVGPGEILVDGNGNPIGGTTIISVDVDAALAAVDALAVRTRDQIAKASQDVYDSLVSLIEALDIPTPVDPEEETALSLIESLAATLQSQIIHASQEAFTSAVALIDKLELKTALKTRGATDEARALVDAAVAGLREELQRAAQDAYDSAVALIEALDIPTPVDPEEETALSLIDALSAATREQIAQAAQDAYSSAVALIDKKAAETAAAVAAATAESRAMVNNAVASLRIELEKAAQDAYDSAVALIEALDIPTPVDPEEETALSLIDALSAAMRTQVAHAAQDVYTSAVALIDKLGLETELKAAGVKDEARALVNAAVASLRRELLQAAQDTFDSAVSLIQELRDKVEAEEDVWICCASNLQNTLKHAISDSFESAIALIDKLKLEAELEALDAKNEARALVNAAVATLQGDLDQMAADASDATASAEIRLNDRIGKIYELILTTAAPTPIATIVPGVGAVRIFAKVIGRRWPDQLEAAVYSLVSFARAVPASDKLTIAGGLPIDGEQVVLDTITYTWRALPVAAYDVNIGADPDTSVDNLVKAINLTGTPGVEYGAGTAKHPSCSAMKSATVVGPVGPSTMDAVALVPGAAGNGLVATETMVNGVWANGGAGLAGGIDMAVFGPGVTTEYEDVAAWNVTITVVGTNVQISVVGEATKTIKWKAEVELLELF